MGSGIVGLLAPAALIIVGWLVEHNFVGRISIFTNSLAINIFAFYLPNVPYYLAWYCDFGLIMGILGLLFYAAGKKKLPGIYYDLGWLYSSIVVGALVIIFTIIG